MTESGWRYRMFYLDLDVLRATYEKLGFLSNFEAAKEAYESLTIRPAVLDEERGALSLHRVDYPLKETQKKMEKAG